ncbi:hypothetical protein ACI7YT_12200 [Microbacterium sp. M]|uniref:hypothetical protein n=1 Tax=Microbacterium sp. M TaxID=3377125 RepID=UPI00386FD3D2
MADATWRLYRHRLTGLVKSYHPRVALADPNLIEVPEGSKPLAYTTIPREAIDALRNAQEDESAEGDLLDDETEE